DQWKQEKLVSHWPELGEYSSDLLSVLDEKAYRDKNIRFIFEDWMSALSNDDRLDRLRPDKANVFNFKMLLNTNREYWNATNIGKIISNYYEDMLALDGAMPNQVTGNHDTDTIRTRLGSATTARAATLMLALLPGAFYIWQGDMLGRPNVLVPEDRQKDGDIGQRDGERVPMQWNTELNGGFSKTHPASLWLPAVEPAHYVRDNLEIQSRDPMSPYRVVVGALQYRIMDPALRAGGIRMLHADYGNILAFARNDPYDPRRQVISLVNFSQDTIPVSILDAHQKRGRIVFSAARGYLEDDKEVDFEKSILMPPDACYMIHSVA
ncbi:MAG TPA: alpha-amylase family glycosyl hydrolase, partial [Candidatus Limnocylindrales bacterium]|nr:alpha-amylase family glycosyl hydrolase [Candidatus Limnocylindrales bacterium]